MGSMVWWILPAVSGIIGLILVLGGVGKLIGARFGSGLARMVLGSGALGIAGVIAFAGLNLQTYKRLTYERPVATITFTENAEQPTLVDATIVYAGGDVSEYTALSGDEFELRARVIKFKAVANMLGYDSVYKLDRFLVGFEQATGMTEVQVERLTENPGLDVWSLAREQKGSQKWVDASYGSGTYNPMAPGLAYEIWITQDALIARPANSATERVTGPQ